MSVYNKTVPTPEAKVVECYANRGTCYRVGFDTAGAAAWVETVYRRASDRGWVRRRIWTKHMLKMSTTAACAIRSAIAKLTPPCDEVACPRRVGLRCDSPTCGGEPNWPQ